MAGVLEDVENRTFTGIDNLVLPTHRLIEYKTLTPPASSPQEPQAKEPAVSKAPPKRTNNSPTNIGASSSKSAPSLYLTPQPSQTSSTTSATSTVIASSSNGVESTSTQTSVPNTPSGSQSTTESPQGELLRKLIGRRNIDGVLQNGVFKGYRRRPHIFERQVGSGRSIRAFLFQLI